MEKIILMSVLTTLGVVSVLYSIVVMFSRLKTKVDVQMYEQNIMDIYSNVDTKHNEIYNKIKENRRDVEEHITYVRTDYQDQINELRRVIDSRCDKLYSQIDNINK
jgi:cell division protein FtsX